MNNKYNKTWIVSAHRGTVKENMHENTLSAFELAGQLGAEMIETDARMTIDGVLIANHDSVAKGFDSNGNNVSLDVAKSTLEEIKSIILAFDDLKGIQYIPTLKEVILVAKKYGMRINIDMKEGLLHAKDIVLLVKECDMLGKVVYATNGSGEETIKTILEIDKDARFIDKPINFNKEKLKNIKNYSNICYAYTDNFSKENIEMIRNNGCLLATININEFNYRDAFKWNPDMAEYPHNSDFVLIENEYKKISQ